MGKKYFIVIIMLLGLIGLYAQEAETPAEKEIKIEVKTIEPYSYVAIEMTGSYEQHEQAFGSLYQSAGEQGIMLSDYPMGVYYNSPQDTPEESLTWEIGFGVSGVDSVVAPLVLKTWPFTSIASTIYEGDYNEGMAAAMMEMLGWIAQNGYQVAGPMQENFLTMPAQNEAGEWVGQLEIVLPVQKIE